MRPRIAACLIVGSIAVAACGGAGSTDDGAIAVPKDLPAAPGPATAVTVATTPGPALKDVALQGSDGPTSWLVEFPSLQSAAKGATAINGALRQLEQAEVDRWKASTRTAAAALVCQSDALLDSTVLLSVRTVCTAGRSAVATLTATFDQVSGARLTLADLFQGGYLQALSAEAVTQLTVGGAPPAQASAAAPPTTAAFSTWVLVPGDLEVTFALPAGPATVSYALGGLAAYVRPSAYLSR
jgi:hypothetical protein